MGCTSSTAVSVDDTRDANQDDSVTLRRRALTQSILRRGRTEFARSGIDIGIQTDPLPAKPLLYASKNLSAASGKNNRDIQANERKTEHSLYHRTAAAVSGNDHNNIRTPIPPNEAATTPNHDKIESSKNVKGDSARRVSFGTSEFSLIKPFGEEAGAAKFKCEMCGCAASTTNNVTYKRHGSIEVKNPRMSSTGEDDSIDVNAIMSDYSQKLCRMCMNATLAISSTSSAHDRGIPQKRAKPLHSIQSASNLEVPEGSNEQEEKPDIALKSSNQASLIPNQEQTQPGIDVSSKPQANSNNRNVVNSTTSKNDGRGDQSRKLQRRQTEPIKLSYGTLKMAESCVETEKALAAVIEEIS